MRFHMDREENFSSCYGGHQAPADSKSQKVALQSWSSRVYKFVGQFSKILERIDYNLCV